MVLRLIQGGAGITGKWGRVFLPLFLLSAFSCMAKSATTTLVASEDAEIDQHVNYNNKNLGSQTSIRLERRDPEFKKPVVSPVSWMLIKWDTAKIPSSAVVKNVEMQIQQVDSAVGVVDVYAVDEGAWSESKVTWNSWTGAKPKITLLGKMSSVPIAKGVTVFKSAAFTKLVQGWVSGSHKNFGLLFKWSGKTGQGDTFLSREHKGKYIKPRLVVSYDAADGAIAAAAKENNPETLVNPFLKMIKPKPVIKGYSGQVAAVMDFDYDMICYLHTPENLKRKVQLLADCGFKRIYIVASPPGDPDYVVSAVPNRKGTYLTQSRKALGEDPLALAVKYFKQAGLEVFIQFKPYEGGGAFTVPEGVKPPYGKNWIKTLGGRAVGVDPFLAKHPEMRPKRKPIDNLLALPADRLEMVFVLDRIPGGTGLKITDGAMELEQRPGFPALGDDAIKRYPVSNVTLYTSKDNGAYDPWSGNVKISERLERRLIRNANGELMFPGAVLCRVIEISGFKTSDPYLAVKFDGDAKAFRTIPYSSSCFSIYSGEQRLPVTVTPRLRNSLLTGKSGFTQNGFEFNELAPYFWDAGWKRNLLYGFARGRAGYKRGTFSEAYPEVREHWLSQIKKFIAMGCDGVDIRMMCHSAGISDFINYSFNPPIVKEYQKRYGVDITKVDPDPINMMKLRGDFFLKFVKLAADLLHANKLKLQMQMHDYQENPTLDPTFPNAGFWAAGQVVPDWRKVITIADEISIKDYNWGVYNPYNAGKIKDAVARLGKPLWVHCYMQQGHDLNGKFIEEVNKDKRVTGLMLYEVVYRPGRVKDGIVEITPDDTVRLVPGSPIDKMLVKSPKPYPGK